MPTPVWGRHRRIKNSDWLYGLCPYQRWTNDIQRDKHLFFYFSYLSDPHGLCPWGRTAGLWLCHNPWAPRIGGPGAEPRLRLARGPAQPWLRWPHPGPIFGERLFVLGPPVFYAEHRRPTLKGCWGGTQGGCKGGIFEEELFNSQWFIKKRPPIFGAWPPPWGWVYWLCPYRGGKRILRGATFL